MRPFLDGESQALGEPSEALQADQSPSVPGVIDLSRKWSDIKGPESEGPGGTGGGGKGRVG